MNTAAAEWAERVAARNAIETAKATKRPELVQKDRGKQGEERPRRHP